MGKMAQSESQEVLGSGYLLSPCFPALSVLFCWALSLGFLCLVWNVIRTLEEMTQCLEALTEKPDSSQGQWTSGWLVVSMMTRADTSLWRHDRWVTVKSFLGLFSEGPWVWKRHLWDSQQFYVSGCGHLVTNLKLPFTKRSLWVRCSLKACVARAWVSWWKFFPPVPS